MILAYLYTEINFNECSKRIDNMQGWNCAPGWGKTSAVAQAIDKQSLYISLSRSSLESMKSYITSEFSN